MSLININIGRLLLAPVFHVLDSFQSMLRIQKRYVFNYGQTEGADKVAIPGRVSTFSSYPGILSSQVSD